MSKQAIIAYLVSNSEGYDDPKFHSVNRENWTIADLFVRQELNNGCAGFGMENVHKVYKYLVKHKEELIKYNLLSKDGNNNFGFALWRNYNIAHEVEEE